MAKKVIVSIVIILVVLAVVFGICFATVPEFNSWCKGLCNKNANPDTAINSELVNLEYGQIIKGVKFDTTKEPDLSNIETPMCFGGWFPLFDYEVDEGYFVEYPLIAVVDLSVVGTYYGFDLKGKVICNFELSDNPFESVIYSDSDIRIGGKFAEELEIPTLKIAKGWNNDYLTKDGEVFFNGRFKVINIYHADTWNGVYMGSIVSNWCKHSVINQGACKECNKCFHETLNLNEKCRVCGREIKEGYLRLSNLDNLEAVYNSSIEDTFKNIELDFYCSENDVVYAIKYPDYSVECFISEAPDYYTAYIVYGDRRQSFSYRVLCNEDYHKTFEVGQCCSACGFVNYVHTINNINGLPEVFECTQSEAFYDLYYVCSNWWAKYSDNINIFCVDQFGYIHDLRDQYTSYSFEIDYESNLLIINLDFDYLSNYQSLQYTLQLNIIENLEV